VLAHIDGDTFFPAIDTMAWSRTHSETIPAGERDSHATEYVIYHRLAATKGR
jgi:dihydrofolate reductase